jgi:hypothetical protein
MQEAYDGQQFVGMDLHRRRSVLVRMTAGGRKLGTARITSSPAGLRQEIARAGTSPKVVLEATYGWYWAADVLEAAGAEVHLAHPLGVKAFREVGYNPDRPNVSRRRMVSFADTIPSLRIAVDLKVELFRNATKPWTMNAIHDIDALSMAVPYCHVVVPDREMVSLLPRSGTGPRHETKIVTTLPGLPDALPELAEQARNVQETGPAGTGQDHGTATASTGTTCSRASRTSRPRPYQGH